MYFKLNNGKVLIPASLMNKSLILASTLLLLLFINNKSHAEQYKQKVVLHIKPAMCVALNQGRTCYAQLNITWSALLTDDFCIVQKDIKSLEANNSSQSKIKCWKNSKGNSISFEFKSNESLTYQLKNTKNETLAETKVEVSWVHEESPRKRRWRLF